MSKERIYYLDKIKILLCILVIGLHTSIAYGGSGMWYYNEHTDSTFVGLIFTIYDAICQSFFMGLFFFISSYFVSRSYEKKGPVKFLKDRFIRLGLPLLFFFFILNPTTMYFIEHFSEKSNYSYISWLIYCISHFENLGTGPLWFVEALLIFNTAYVIYRIFTKSRNNISHQKSIPSNRQILILNLAIGFIAFLVRIFYPTGKEFLSLQLGYFTQYVALFIVGIISYENNWLKQITKECADFWLKIAGISCVVILPLMFLGGITESVEPFLGNLHWQALVYAMWEPFMCIGISLKLITFFRDNYNNTTGSIFSKLGQDTFTVFIIHAPVSVFLECILIPLTIHPFIKFAIVVISTCLICFSLSHYLLRKVPVLKNIL